MSCAVSGHHHTAAGARPIHVGKRPGTICVLPGLGPCMHEVAT